MSDKKPAPFPPMEYSVRIWRSGPEQFSVTMSVSRDGERDVTRKVVGSLERAYEVANAFLQ